MSEAGEEAVIVALASAEAVTVGVEGHAGDDGKVDGGIVREELSCGLLDMEGTLARGAVEDAKLQVVTDHDGEENEKTLSPASPVSLRYGEGLIISMYGRLVLLRDGS